MSRLFGTNGIREVVGERLTAPFVTSVGDAIAAVLPPRSRVVVGRDGRTSSLAFSRIMAGTLCLAGHHVVDVGLLPTPAIQYLVPRLEGAMGVILTASHNPPEFNGIKCIAADGLELLREDEERIEANVAGQVRPPTSYTGVGTITKVTDGAHRYVEGILAQVDAEKIRARHFAVLLDCGNGASVPTSPILLRRLGCRVMTLNGHVDGTFPGHLSEPTEAHTRDTQRAVAALGADVGIIHDGDADRAVFVDASGKYIPGEQTLTLLARDAVQRHSGGVVVTPVSASLSVEEAIHPLGGTVVYTRVGSPSVTHEMQVRGAVFGGEENGGLILPSFQLARDGAMTAALVLDLMARTGRTLADLLADLPQYTLVKEKVSCPVEIRPKVMDRVAEEFRASSEQVVTIDGVKAFRTGGWVLLRPSGTEPLIRVFAESKDPARARRLADEALDAVRRSAAEVVAQSS